MAEDPGTNKQEKARKGLVFNSFRIEEDLFKDQVFNLDTGKINVITGHNHNSGGGKDDPNGVGKSFFFSAIPEFILDEPAIGTKKDKSRVGRRTLELTRDGIKYKIVRAFTSGRESITVYKNNKDLGIRELKEAKAYINKVIGLNKAEVYTFLHINFMSPHPLIAGDTATRRAFFTSFFRQFELLEHYRTLVAAEVSKVKLRAAQYVEAKRHAETLQSKLPKESLTELRTTKKKLAAKFESLSASLPRLMEAAELSAQVSSITSKETRQKVAYLGLEEKFSEAALLKKSKELKAEGRSLSSLLGAIEARQSKLDRIPKLEASIENLKAEFSDLGDIPDKKDIESRIEKYTSSLKLLSSSFEDGEEKRRALVRKVSDAESALEHLEDCTRGECSQCGSKIKVDSGKVEEKKEASALLRSLKNSLRQQEDKLKDIANQEASLRRKKKTADDLIDAARTSDNLKSRIASLKENLESLREELSVKDTSDKETLEKQLEEVDRKLDAIEELLPKAKVLSRWKELPQEIKDNLGESGSLASMQAELSKINTELSYVSSRLSVAEEIATGLEEINKRVQELSDSEEVLEELEILTKALSKKGAETIVIKSLCSQVQQQINRYSKLVMPEDYVFGLDMGTDFSIQVTRLYGGKERSSDVRKLSGAESGLFSLVLLVALLSFIPKHRRPNLLIMDEPMATMGESNIERFIRFLPTLKSVIPNIVIITPKQVERFKDLDAEIWTVEKKGLRSRIRSGMVA